MDRHVIIGVHVTGRNEHAVDVQRLLTSYGCQIKTRIGLHDVHGDYCSPNGLIVLEAIDDPETDRMIESLAMIDGIDVRTMVFKH